MESHEGQESPRKTHRALLNTIFFNTKNIFFQVEELLLIEGRYFPFALFSSIQLIVEGWYS